MTATIPTPIVARSPIGSRPGWKSLPSAPTISPVMISPTIHMVRPVSATTCAETSQPAQELSLLLLELEVRECALVAQVGELAELILDVIGVRLCLRVLLPATQMLRTS